MHNTRKTQQSSSPLSASNQRGPRPARKLLATALTALAVLALASSTRGQASGGDAATTRPAAPRNGGSDIVSEGLDENGQIRLAVGKSAVLTTRSPYRQVSIGQPEVADVNTIGPGSILVTAKRAGSTQLIVWDEANRSQVVDVFVSFDLGTLEDQLKTMFPGAKIEVASAGNGIVLRGRVPSLQVAEQAVAVTSPYSERVLNLLEISGGQQVMLQVRFAEVSRSATRQLGVNIGYSDGDSFGASNIGQVNPFDVTAGALASSAVNPAVTVFGRAQFGDTTLDFFINALRQNNLLRMLAEPNLIAISGQEASFLAGGEFPVPVTQGGASGAGGTAITVEYREFGVRLRMVPIVLGDGRIRIKVAPEVSDLDFTTAVRFNGFVIPGLTSRKVETTVELAEGQTFAIAGLLNQTTTSSKDSTPFLGDLPIFGALFRSVRYQKKETELVVLVTPRLVEAMNPDQVPGLPGENWRDPTDAELFGLADIGGELPVDRPAAPTTAVAEERRVATRYIGDYGFVPSTQPEADAFAGPSID